MSSGVNATEDTIYDLGSISKTFTSLLMGKLFAERKLNLWDPVDEYLPKELGLRGEDGTPINVRIISLCSSKVTVWILESLKQFLHLATHNSGLPRMPSNLSVYSDPSEYAQEDLFNFLEGYQPTNVGKNYSYSNLGFATLGKALEFCQVY